MFIYAQSSIVTVHKAQRTETKKDKDGRDLISFVGDVFLTIEKDNIVIAISADKVNFDRERNMLYAADKVIMTEKVAKSSDKTLSGNSLLMNTSTLEGVFDDVKFVQKQTNVRNLSAETTLIVSSEIFSREEGGTVVFKKARLTFCDEENPHWQLRSSRLFLLPGAEFALLNAVLFIGRVPILYLPFFYYPKDEMIFNPVFGYRPRVGYFTQTTTYLIGRKPLPEDSSQDDALFNFAQPSQLMQQRRDGLFLRNLDTPLGEDYSKDYLKILLDGYSNLGAMVGVQGEFSSTDSYFKNISFYDLIGVSRNLYNVEENALFSPYNTIGKSEWNKSNLFGKKLPFRFAAGLELEGSGDYTTFNISLPFYSDPFFKSDFLNRSENMDWINYATTQGISTEAERKKFTDSIVESYVWKIDGSITPNWGKVSDFFNFRLTSFYSSLDWASKQDTTIKSDVDPARCFFYPAKIVPFAATASIDGAIFSYPPKKKEPILGEVPKIDLDKPVVWIGQGETAEQNSFSNELPFPVLAVNSPSVKEIEEFKYLINYNYTPNFISLYNYSAESWPNASTKAEAWKDYMSNFIGFSGDFTLSSSATWYNGFVSLDDKFVFSPSYQEHFHISEKFYPTDAARNQVKLSDYMARKFDITNTNTLKFRPFVLNDVWSESYIAWNTQFRLIRTEFVGTASAPVWKYHTVEGTEKAIPVHNIAAAAIYRSNDLYSNLALVSQLPPLLPKYSVNFSAAIPHFTAKIETGFAVRSREDPTWNFLPFVEEISVNALNNKLSIAQSYKYLPDSHRHDYLNFSASYGGLSFKYSKLYTTGFKFDDIAGWKSDGEEKFRSFQGVLSYKNPAKTYFWWGNRIGFAPSLSTGIVWDFLRPPMSYFTFSPACHFRINEFIEIRFASEHRNDVIFRYFQDALGTGPHIPGETNLWQDLIDSFNFAEYNKRKMSGFKLKSLSLEMNHNLHDWDIKSKFKIEPRLLTEKGITRYDYSPYISVSVVWKPMSAMRSHIVDEYGSIKLNP
ncbi:MAG: LPS-assembly protein LptD [Treponema sp.]|nr:LPS-assembly protein LptD [Treponema sp.]